MDLWTWAPFDSEEVKEIKENLTKVERKRLISRSIILGGMFGLLSPFIFIPILLFVPVPLNIILYLVYLGIMILIVNRYMKKFYCSTRYAGERGIEEEELELKRFGL